MNSHTLTSLIEAFEQARDEELRGHLAASIRRAMSLYLGEATLTDQEKTLVATGRKVHAMRAVMHRLSIDSAQAKTLCLQHLAELMSRQRVELYVLADATGRITGVVTPRDIADKLRTLGFKVKPEQINTAPIQELGLVSVPVRLNEQVEANIKVWTLPVEHRNGLVENS